MGNDNQFVDQPPFIDITTTTTPLKQHGNGGGIKSIQTPLEQIDVRNKVDSQDERRPTCSYRRRCVNTKSVFDKAFPLCLLLLLIILIIYILFHGRSIDQKLNKTSQIADQLNRIESLLIQLQRNSTWIGPKQMNSLNLLLNGQDIKEMMNQNQTILNQLFEKFKRANDKDR